MEEQKRENKEELQQETAEEKNSGQGNSSTRSSLLWIFAGGYLVYTGKRQRKLLKIRKLWQRKKCQLRSGRILRKIWMTHRRRKTKNKTGCR